MYLFLFPLGEEFDKLGWIEAELGRQAKGDARKVRIAQRLRKETSVTLKWIAHHLRMGTWTHVTNRPYHQASTETNNQSELKLCQY